METLKVNLTTVLYGLKLIFFTFTLKSFVAESNEYQGLLNKN